MLGSAFQVEHIIREENMMAAQEILELFCELIAVRLPIIETQRLLLQISAFFLLLFFLLSVFNSSNMRLSSLRSEPFW